MVVHMALELSLETKVYLLHLLERCALELTIKGERRSNRRK